MPLFRAPRADPTFVVTFGLHGSGSTWIFNVVRQLLEEARLSFNSADGELLGDDGLLDQPLRKAPFTILKTHSLSLPLLRVMEIASTKVIVSTRDPRDSALSHLERFGFTLTETVNAMSRAMASGKSLASHVPKLVYRYEDRFMDDPATVGEIARFLDIPVDRRTIDRIFKSLRPESIKKLIANHPRIRSTSDHDPVTRWNGGHIGDGRSGKWRERLPPEYLEAVDGALSILDGDEWKTRPVRWSAELFSYGTGLFDQAELPSPHGFRRSDVEIDIAPGPTKRLELDGDEQFAVFGPYLYAPAGRWRATIDVDVADEISGAVYADVFRPATQESLTSVRLPSVTPFPVPIEMEFDHPDHFNSIELRLIADKGTFGTLNFSGASLHWRGPL